MNLKLDPRTAGENAGVLKLAPLADLYVCDAFAAAHRDQPSLCGFEQVLPSAMGRLFEREYCVISELMECPARPCAFVLGGAKVSDAFLMLGTVLRSGSADIVLTAGSSPTSCSRRKAWRSAAAAGHSSRSRLQLVY
jgi:phosphoglycerate kinase